MNAVEDEQERRSNTRRQAQSEREQRHLDVIRQDARRDKWAGEAGDLVERFRPGGLELEKAAGDQIVAEPGMKLNGDVADHRGGEQQRGRHAHRRQIGANHDRKPLPPGNSRHSLRASDMAVEDVVGADGDVVQVSNNRGALPHGSRAGEIAREPPVLLHDLAQLIRPEPPQATASGLGELRDLAVEFLPLPAEKFIFQNLARCPSLAAT